MPVTNEATDLATNSADRPWQRKGKGKGKSKIIKTEYRQFVCQRVTQGKYDPCTEFELRPCICNGPLLAVEWHIFGSRVNSSVPQIRQKSYDVARAENHMMYSCDKGIRKAVFPEHPGPFPEHDSALLQGRGATDTPPPPPRPRVHSAAQTDPMPRSLCGKRNREYCNSLN